MPLLAESDDTGVVEKHRDFRTDAAPFPNQAAAAITGRVAFLNDPEVVG